MKLNKRLWSVGIAITLILLLLLLLYREWDQLSQYKIQFRYSLLVASMILLVAHNILDSLGWRSTMSRIGYKLPLRKAVYIRMLSNFGRFIPGTIWILMSRAHLCRKEGIPFEKTTVSIMYDLLMSVLAAIFVGLVSLYYIGASKLPLNPLWIALIVPFALLLMHPKFIDFLVKLSMRMLKRQHSPLGVKYKHIVKILVCYYIPSWTITGIAFYLFVDSFYDVPNEMLLILPGIFALSWLLGYMTFVIPAGLGVREGILTLLLGIFVPMPIAILISLLSRLWMVGCEVITTLLVIRH